MIDRLCHRVEIVQLEGKSYRAKEAAAVARRSGPLGRSRRPRQDPPHRSEQRAPAAAGVLPLAHEITRMLMIGNSSI